MFILISRTKLKCAILDTSDFVVDMCSEQFCEDMINNGYQIIGISKGASKFFYEPRLGALPPTIPVEFCGDQALCATLRHIQKQGVNLSLCGVAKLKSSSPIVKQFNMSNKKFRVIQLYYEPESIRAVVENSFATEKTLGTSLKGVDFFAIHTREQGSQEVKYFACLDELQAVKTILMIS